MQPSGERCPASTRRYARPSRGGLTRGAEAWAAEVVDHLRRSLASRFGLVEKVFPDAVIAALRGRAYLEALDRRRQAAVLRDDGELPPMRDLLAALSAHTRRRRRWNTFSKPRLSAW